MEALGKGPEVVRNDAEWECEERETTVETEAERKQVEEGGVMVGGGDEGSQGSVTAWC